MPTRRQTVEATLYWFVRLARQAQSMTNGYFGGYIGKGQAAGQMEIKKCIDKMHALRDRMHTEKKPLAEQRRSVTGRMVTDLEMNDVYRCAVEQFEKIHALQDRMHTEKKSIAEQRRSVTGRVVTDLEMNGLNRNELLRTERLLDTAISMQVALTRYTNENTPQLSPRLCVKMLTDLRTSKQERTLVPI